MRWAGRPGYLVSAGGRITFTDGEPYFGVALDELADVTRPWYRFGGGVTLRAAGTLCEITFYRPGGTPSPDPSLVDVTLSALGLGVTIATGATHVGCAPWSRGHRHRAEGDEAVAGDSARLRGSHLGIKGSPAVGEGPVVMIDAQRRVSRGERSVTVCPIVRYSHEWRESAARRVSPAHHRKTAVRTCEGSDSV